MLRLMPARSAAAKPVRHLSRHRGAPCSLDFKVTYY